MPTNSRFANTKPTDFGDNGSKHYINNFSFLHPLNFARFWLNHRKRFWYQNHSTQFCSTSAKKKGNGPFQKPKHKIKLQKQNTKSYTMNLKPKIQTQTQSMFSGNRVF